MRAALFALALAGCANQGLNTSMAGIADRPAEIVCGWRLTGTITVEGDAGTCWLMTPAASTFATSPAGTAGPCDVESSALVYAAGDRIDRWTAESQPGDSVVFYTPAVCP